jgi:hypothetical protein
MSLQAYPLDLSSDPSAPMQADPYPLLDPTPLNRLRKARKVLEEFPAGVKGFRSIRQEASKELRNLRREHPELFLAKKPRPNPPWLMFRRR